MIPVFRRKKNKRNILHSCRWILDNLWSVVNDGCLHSLLGDSLKDKVTQTTKPNRIYGCCWSCNLFRMSHSQISCRALRFLEAAPHLLQEGAPDQSCSKKFVQFTWKLEWSWCRGGEQHCRGWLEQEGPVLSHISQGHCCPGPSTAHWASAAAFGLQQNKNKNIKQMS